MDAHFDKERSLLTPVEPRPAVSRRRLMPLLATVFAGIVVYSALQYRGAQQLQTTRTLADIRFIESAFHAVFRAHASYVLDGCDVAATVAACALFGARSADDVLLQTPMAYAIAATPTATSFAVRFSLAQRVGSLAKGEHVVNERGIE